MEKGRVNIKLGKYLKGQKREITNAGSRLSLKSKVDAWRSCRFSESPVEEGGRQNWGRNGGQSEHFRVKHRSERAGLLR